MSSVSLRALKVWLVLIGASCGAWILAERHPLGALSMLLVLLTAGLKIWLVTRYFMSVSLAPRGIQLVIQVWIVGCIVMIGAFFWTARLP